MSASLETCVVLLALCGALPYADSSPEEREHSKHERIKQVTDVLDMSGSIRDSIADYGLSLVIPDTDSPGIHTKTKRAVSLLAQGALALRTLLTGAKSIYSPSRRRRCFEKEGTLFTALKDFEEVNPKNVKEYTNPRGVKYVFGWVGDRKLQITSPGAQGDTLLDIIDTTQTKLRRPGIPYVDRIIYTTSKNAGK